MSNNLEEFLNSKIPEAMRGIYMKEMEWYKDRYDICYQLPLTLLKSEDLIKTKINHFLSVMKFLKITPNEPFYFWLVKLYFSLPLSDKWNFETDKLKKNFLVYDKKIKCKLRPSFGYIYFLLDLFRKNMNHNKKVKESSMKNQRNFFHIFKKEDTDKAVFFDIKLKYIEFLKKTKEVDQKENFGRLNYFVVINKETHQVFDEGNNKDENFIENKFSILNNEQKYLKFKFKSLLKKKTDLNQESKIFNLKKYDFQKKDFIKKKLMKNPFLKTIIENPQNSENINIDSKFNRNKSFNKLKLKKINSFKSVDNLNVIQKNPLTERPKLKDTNNKENNFKIKFITPINQKNDFLFTSKKIENLYKENENLKKREKFNNVTKDDFAKTKVLENDFFFRDRNLNVQEIILFKRKNLKLLNINSNSIFKQIGRNNYLEERKEEVNIEKGKKIERKANKLLSLPATGSNLLSFAKLKKTKKKIKK